MYFIAKQHLYINYFFCLKSLYKTDVHRTPELVGVKLQFSKLEKFNISSLYFMKTLSYEIVNAARRPTFKTDDLLCKKSTILHLNIVYL